eukprot:SAG31_NODE_3499_length_4193_cov_2.250611_4_plen_65_part_00
MFSGAASAVRDQFPTFNFEPHRGLVDGGCDDAQRQRRRQRANEAGGPCDRVPCHAEEAAHTAYM